MQDGEFRTIQREKRQYTLSHGCRNKVVMDTVLNRSCNYLNGEGGGHYSLGIFISSTLIK